jgi:VanZ family protein
MFLLQILRKRYFPYLLLIVMHVLLLVPGNKMPDEDIQLIPNFDKLVHFGMYALLTTAWTLLIFQNSSISHRRKIIYTILLLLLAIGDGIAIEFLQKTPLIHRDFDWYDALADGLGAGTGILAGRFFHGRLAA